MMKLWEQWREALAASVDGSGTYEAEETAYARWTEYAHDRHICYDCGKQAKQHWNYCDAHAEDWMD